MRRIFLKSTSMLIVDGYNVSVSKNKDSNSLAVSVSLGPTKDTSFYPCVIGDTISIGDRKWEVAKIDNVDGASVSAALISSS